MKDIMDVFTKKNQRGASLIIIIAIILIMGIIAAVFVSLINTESFTAMNQSAGEEAFAIAEGGLEFEQRSLAQNLDWYRSASDPIATTTKTLGSGSFEVKSNLPATMLRTRISTAASTNDIRVYTTNRFPSSGFIQVDDDMPGGNAEFISYTGISGDTFTGISRNNNINGVIGAANPFPRGTRVYPVTTLVSPLVSNCTTIPNPFQIAANIKFLSAGTIEIYHDNAGVTVNEEVSYAGSSTSGGITTLSGIQRCQNATGPITASSGDPITTLVVDAASPDYEAEATSTGTVVVAVTGNVIRVTKKTMSR